MSPRRAGQRLLVLSVPVILALTLLPIGSGREPPFPCLICGEHGTADALLNLMLFIPVGVGLRWSGAQGWRPFLLAALLSALIELAQTALPGRHASLGDVLFNATGGAVGAALANLGPAGLRRFPSPLARAGLAVAVAGGLWAATGYLLRPALPPPPYFGQWTPNLGPDQWYRGRILEASWGGLAIDSARLLDADSVRALFLQDGGGGAALRVRAIAGPPSDYIAPLVRLHGAHEQEVIQVAFDRHDFVLLYRTRAAALRLDQPDLRIPGAARDFVPGDTIELAARRGRHGFTVEIGDATPRLLGFTLGHGWALVLYVEEFPPWLRTALNVCWIAGCVVLPGYWAAPRAAALTAGAILVALLLIIPPAAGLLPTPLIEFVAAVAGFAAGGAVQRLTGTGTGPPVTNA